jgi:glutamate racemase
VLGCTHYPFLAPVIRELAGEDVAVVDPAEETVKELAALLALQANAADSDDRVPTRASAAQNRIGHRFFASGATASFYSSGRQFLGNFPFQVEQVDLDESDRKCDAGGL